MTIEQGMVGAVVKIRTPRYSLILPLAIAGLFLGLATGWGTGGDQIVPAPFWLAGAGVIVAQAFWMLSWGVDLTPETANLRGIPRRSIPWQDVQAVVRYEQVGSRMVRLIPENGKPVTLRAPRGEWGLGGAAYERDFHRIGQWWLAHRGESLRPVRPEAPRLPVQGETSRTQPPRP